MALVPDRARSGFKEEIVDLDEDIDIDVDLVKLELVTELLQKFLEVIDSADAIFGRLPASVRDAIQKSNLTPDEQLLTLSLAVSKMTTETRQVMSASVEGALQIITDKKKKLQASSAFSMEDCIMAVDIIRFSHKLQAKSRGWLRSWLWGAKGSDGAGYLVIYCNGDKKEARHVYKLSEAARKELGIEL